MQPDDSHDSPHDDPPQDDSPHDGQDSEKHDDAPGDDQEGRDEFAPNASTPPPVQPPLEPPANSPSSSQPPTQPLKTSGDGSQGLSPFEQSPFEQSPFAKGAEIESARAPSFTLLHVFFWTLGVSIALSVDTSEMMMMGAMDDDPEAALMMNAISGVTRIGAAIGMGPLVGMLPFWFLYRRRGVSFPYHPGHWLILLNGASFLVQAVGSWIQRATISIPSFDQIDSNPFAFMGVFYVITGVSSLVACIVSVMAFRDLKRDKLIWRLSFGSLALQHGFQALGGLAVLIGMIVNELAANETAIIVGIGVAGMLGGCITYLTGLLMLIAIIMDLAEKTRRDWLHWMPILLGIISMVVMMVGMGIGMALVMG